MYFQKQSSDSSSFVMKLWHLGYIKNMDLMKECEQWRPKSAFASSLILLILTVSYFSGQAAKAITKSWSACWSGSFGIHIFQNSVVHWSILISGTDCKLYIGGHSSSNYWTVQHGSVVQNLTKLLTNVMLKFPSLNIANTLIFFAEKNVSSFWLQKLLTFLQQKYQCI